MPIFKFRKDRDAVTLRKGDPITGAIIEKQITIDMHGNSIAVPFSKIAWLLFKSDFGQPVDQIQLTNGSAYSGTIKTPTLTVDVEDLDQKLKLATADILTIQNIGEMR